MKILRLCFARPCRADALLRQVEIAQIGAEHRDSKGNLLPLSPDADLRLVTLAAQRIIERAWGSRAITTRAKTSKPPRAFARRITTEALEQLQLILERGKEREAAGGCCGDRCGGAVGRGRAGPAGGRGRARPRPNHRCRSKPVCRTIPAAMRA